MTAFTKKCGNAAFSPLKSAVMPSLSKSAEMPLFPKKVRKCRFSQKVLKCRLKPGGCTTFSVGDAPLFSVRGPLLPQF